MWQNGHRLTKRPYQIIDTLGRGGFGLTYKALHIHLERVCVIKTPDKIQRRDTEYEKYLKRFKKEGQRLARFGEKPHPNIVQVTDYFEEASLPCLVMDYVDGETLFEVIRRRGAIPEGEMVGWIKQIGHALIEVHGKGIVHRDAHPGNIMIRKDGMPILIDFGIAKEIVPAGSSTTDMYGNKGFAPYEQLHLGKREVTVDVYTLAASLYYGITGEFPTTSTDRRFFDTDLVYPTRYQSRISPRVNLAILKGMALEAKDRPQTMTEWLTLLAADSVSSPQVLPQRTITLPSLSVPSFASVMESAGEGIVRLKGMFPAVSSIPVSRRRMLQLLGLTVVGGGGTLIVRTAMRNKKNSPLTFPSVKTETKLSDSEVEFDVITVNSKGEETRRTRKKASYYTEDLNGVPLEMMQIPAGRFWMGTEDAEIERLVKKFNWEGFRREQPRHEVTIPAFAMGKFPITQAQYQAVMGENSSYFKGENRPVEQVSWEDADKFCQQLSEMTGKQYRLPSEAEWEYACCAASTEDPFYFGETITSKLANYNAFANFTFADEPIEPIEPIGTPPRETTPVGTFPPNAFGLYDMHGNVWEWCADDWNDNYKNAPIDGSEWLDENSNFHVLRSGSWDGLPFHCRIAYRASNGSVTGYGNISLRVVCPSFYLFN
ncbi:MAG: SUMF1/EgtB/PvdO family nonheme iron enzyme [Microcystaceae cyanobacterium]